MTRTDPPTMAPPVVSSSTSRHSRRWASDTVPSRPFTTSGSPSSSSSAPPSAAHSDAEDEYEASHGSRHGDEQQLVEVTLDFHDDNTVVLRRVEPAAAVAAAGSAASSFDLETGAIPIPTSMSSPSSPSSTVARTSSSSRLRNLFYGVDIRAEGAVAKARQFSQELRAELRKLSCKSSAGGAVAVAGPGPGAGAPTSAEYQSKLEARAIRRHRARLDREWSGAKKAIRGLRFISKPNGVDAWNEVQSHFQQLAKDGLLARSDFAQCIGMKDSKEFALELFDALSRRRRIKAERITKDELFEFWSQISDESFDSRLQLFFDMVDKNADGRIGEAEVKEIIMLSASANRLSRLKEQAGEYAALIMEELDPEELGFIELWQLETLLLQKDTYMNYSQAFSHTSQPGAQCSLQLPSSSSSASCRKRGRIRCLGTKLGYWFLDNWRRLWVLALWVAVMAGLFAWKFTQYRRRYVFQVMGYCVTTAKGAAETLKLNMALILFPVCRNTITWLRNTRLGTLVPFDDNINFHKTIAAAIVVGIILHAGNHMTCDFPRLLAAPDGVYSPLSDDFGDQRPTYMSLVRGIEGVTGVLMVLLMAVAFVLATSSFRRSLLRMPRPFDRVMGFNAFWYSHHMFLLVYVLLVVHGQCLYLVHHWYRKTTWMYLALPVLLYAGERTLRAFRSGHYAVRIHKVALYPGNVLTLHMSKPQAFRYKSGQYVFVKCPDVSPFEWHPFSITSAPDDGYISIHIRQLGDWTQELKRVFAEACEPSNAGESGLLRADETTRKSLPKLLIDGPYGSPAQDYKKYDVLLLIGLGIGATPFISILRDLLNNIVKRDELEDFESEFSQTTLRSFLSVDPEGNRVTPRRKKPLETTNAYFYWVTREQGSFDWFKGVLNEVAELDQRGIIEMHNYLTSVYEEGDARSALITMVQALNHAKHGIDIVSGTRVRTHFARPNWRKVLKRACARHPNATIGVFYCGNRPLAQELSNLCKEHNQSGSPTKLEFHKEHF